jgi:hypothetical protein
MPFAETARAPKSSLRSEVAYGSKVAAAKLRPTVAVLGESGVLDDGTAASWRRQGARVLAVLNFKSPACVSRRKSDLLAWPTVSQRKTRMGISMRGASLESVVTTIRWPSRSSAGMRSTNSQR